MPADGKTTYTDSAIDEAIKSLLFDANGLVPAIAQQHDSGEVLMPTNIAR